MAKDLIELCKEILEKAHKIEMDVEGKIQVRYFITPEDDLYKKISKLKIGERSQIIKILNVPLSFIDIKNDFASVYTEKGVAGDRYSALPAENRIRIEEVLGIKKKPRMYG